jgi:hypothetical protein
MDYSKITDVEPTDVTYDIKIGLRYGEMPDDALISKFEMTDDYNPENDYHYYAKKQLTDRRPDTATFEHEKPRQSIGNKGYLNLIHSGNRGGSEPRHSEIFLEDTWGDPRGIATDPNYMELRKQFDERMPYVRWSADADNSVPQGVWNEWESMRKQQMLFRQVAPRLAIFTTSKDGRRLGVSRVFQHESNLGKVDKAIQTYGDLIKEYAENPQRSTTILSNTIIARTRMYHQFTTDHEFQVAKYGQDNRKRKLTNDMQPLKYSDLDAYLPDCDKTVGYKAMGILMSQIVKNKHQTAQDIDYGKASASQVRKSEALSRDLAMILKSINQDADFSSSDQTRTGKTACQKQLPHGANVTTPDNYKPAHHLLNAELIYKAVKGDGDYREIQKNIVTDDRRVDVGETQTKNGKTAQKKSTHQKKGMAHVEVDGQSLVAHNYKSAKAKQECKPGSQSQDGDFQTSDPTQNRKTPTSEYTTPSVDDVDQNMDFSDNTCKERHLAPLGDKYMFRQIHRDISINQNLSE